MGKKIEPILIREIFIEYGREDDKRRPSRVSDIKQIKNQIDQCIITGKYDELQKLLVQRFVYPEVIRSYEESIELPNDKRYFTYNEHYVSTVVEALYDSYPDEFASLIGIASVSDQVGEAFLGSLKGTDLANYQWDMATKINVGHAVGNLKTHGLALNGKKDASGSTVVALAKLLDSKLPDDKKVDEKDVSAKTKVVRFKDKLNFISAAHSQDEALEAGRSCLRFLSCFNTKTAAEDKIDAVQLAAGLPSIKPRQIK